MMNAKPHDRIKIQNIKNHAFFTLYKINFNEELEERASNLSQSNLLSDSMMLEGEDPFDDFMNKKLVASGQNSARQSEGRDSNSPPVPKKNDFGEKTSPESSLINSAFKKACPKLLEDKILPSIPEEKERPVEGVESVGRIRSWFDAKEYAREQ